MKKEQLILLVVLVLGAVFILTANINSKRITNPFASPTPFPTIPTKTSDGQSLITMMPSASSNIEVLTPRTGDVIKSGTAVKGNARVFENVVSIRLSDSQGNVLVETTAMANSPDTGKFGPFEKILNFTTQDSQGTLEVFQASAKDGSEIDKVLVPVIFK